MGCFCKPQPCHGDVIADYLNHLPEVTPVKLAVVGSRFPEEHTDVAYKQMEATLDFFDIKTIISGGARGVDALATRYAEENAIPYQEFPADWDTHGKSAGYKRNVLIVNACEEVAAFWDGVSKGTKHSIDIADKKGKPVHLFKLDFWEDDVGNWG